VTGPVAERGLLDTSAVIELASLDEEDLPVECLISAVTLAELSAGTLLATNARQRAARQAHLQQAEADFDFVPFDATCARAFGRVTASLRRSGRKHQARAYDALIAATAVAHDLPVFTRNADDFAGIDGLSVRSV
jgi:tRNA(fMet)-specific endonuclease VapC